MTRGLAPVLALSLAALAGCGGSDKSGSDPAKAPADTRQAAPAPKPDPAVVRVIRGWTDTLRHGDVKGASDYFAIPVVVQNGGPEAFQLRSRPEVEFFNRTLPCGATLERVQRVGPYTVGVFRLTERPGEGQCGTGVGHEAAVAFIVQRHRITQWIRAKVPAKEPAKPKASAV